jgi:hypothetical protein
MQTDVIIIGAGSARRLTFSGAKVLACIEIMKKSSGLVRNVVQCLNDYDIPLLLSHTVTDVEGREHVTGVKVSEVDDALKPLKKDPVREVLPIRVIGSSGQHAFIARVGHLLEIVHPHHHPCAPRGAGLKTGKKKSGLHKQIAQKKPVSPPPGVPWRAVEKVNSVISFALHPAYCS